MATLPETQSQTAAAIEAAWVPAQEVRDDRVLRGSAIGQECDRRLWYAFRWAHDPERHGGRQLRLFETGNIEEQRIVDDLRRIGCEVDDVDPATGHQFEVTFLGGHCTGHTDGLVRKVPEAPVTPHLLECKSHNDKSFKALKKDGVQKSKPMHYAQMQGYMHGRSLTRALYVAVNKNDDEIYTERLNYDPAYAGALIAKAERIITAARPPAKLHEDPAAKMAWACGYCPAKGVCHDGAFSRRTCRTCLHATPRLDGDARWTCERFGVDLDLETQAVGCPHHLFIPDLVPGEQVDADADAEVVVYQLRDGSEWRDEALRSEATA